MLDSKFFTEIQSVEQLNQMITLSRTNVKQLSKYLRQYVKIHTFKYELEQIESQISFIDVNLMQDQQLSLALTQIIPKIA